MSSKMFKDPALVGNEGMAAMQASQFSQVLVLSPTGWTWEEVSKKKKPEDPSLCAYSFRRSGNRITYGLPYRFGAERGIDCSEHSSCEELEDFLERLNYKEIEFIV